jgi:polar amino acid transport system ATP-binding protein
LAAVGSNHHPNAQPMVSCAGLTKRFGDLHVLRGIDFQAAEGEKVAIIGPSGSGKTTFLRLVIGLERPTAGTVHLAGQPLWGHEPNPSDKHLRKVRSVAGYVFQHFNLFPHMTALENVVAAPIYARDEPRQDAEARGRELLRTVGLADKAGHYPAQLSGGQQQRVAIARALALDPRLMLFDEVTSALDPELAVEVLRVIAELGRRTSMTMLLVTHEMTFARRFADRVVFFDGGNVVEEGAPAELFGQPQNERTRAFLHTVLDPI